MAERLIAFKRPGTEAGRTPTRVSANRAGLLSVINDVARTAGKPLENSIRTSMELRFGHDFSQVRVHADARAGDLAQTLSARAFTAGTHLVFAPGQYSPSTNTGRRLLAHELTHVIQQRAGTVRQAGTVSQPGDPSEFQADRIAEEIAAGRTAPELPIARHAQVADTGLAVVQRDGFQLPLGPVSRVAERGLEFITKWGRNASPFKLAWTYFKLNRSGLAALSDVSGRVKMAKDLQKKVHDLESSARRLRKAVNEQRTAEAGLPAYPLETDKAAGHMMVTEAELAYVEKYFNAAALIANDAMDARAALNNSIDGWDDVMARAKSSADFTRAAVWEAVIGLDMRFQSDAGSFRAFLVDARDTASRVESWARVKQFHAADILGKWTPDNYRAPSPP